MKSDVPTTLKRELREAGASDIEAEELVGLARRLRTLRAVPERQKVDLRLGLVPVSLVAAVTLLIGMATVAFSQTSLPDSWLYPVKRLSEDTAVAVSPGYRATLMMRRADEVRQLVANGAKPATVVAALSTYQVEAAAYRSVNYPAFAYCRSNLRQAENDGTPTERAQIAAVLKTLSDVE